MLGFFRCAELQKIIKPRNGLTSAGLFAYTAVCVSVAPQQSGLFDIQI